MTRLGDLAEINPPPGPVEGPLSWIGISTINAERATARPSPFDGAGSGNRIARPGDVLFARISPSMENGKLAIVPRLETTAAMVSSDLLVLRPRPGVDPGLIWAFLRQRALREELKQFLVGSAGRLRLRSEVIEQLEIAVPDERSWEEASAALVHLDAARQLFRPLERLLRALPANAAATVAAERSRGPLAGFFVELRPGSEVGSQERGSVPILRAPNVAGGWIDETGLRFAAERLPEDSHLRRGDLLVVRFSGSPERVGRVAVYDGSPDPSVHASSLIRIRCPDLEPDFLWAWLQTEEARAAMSERIDASSRRYRLDVKSLAEIPVPVLGDAAEAEIAAFARQARELLRQHRERQALLDRTVEAHLAKTFAGRGAVAAVDPAAGAKSQPPDYLPRTLAAASAAQQSLWRRVIGMTEGFGLGDLAEADADYADVQHSLAVFEQLGLVVREHEDEAYRWRLPNAELDVLR